jgi:ABC-type antimicrobial peptide transport system permease subunit
MAATGILLGLGASLVAAPLLEDLLFNVNAVDWMVFSAVTVLLLGVAIVASALPSLRAARADPAEALRTD